MPGARGGPVVRPMVAADLDAVAAIERLCIPTPWPREVFAAELGRSDAHVDVAQLEGVVGFANARYVLDEVHLLVIATRPDRQRRGVAAALMASMFATARTRGATTAWLEVRSRNHGAIGLYRRFGFADVALRRRYYADDGSDALVMRALVA